MLVRVLLTVDGYDAAYFVVQLTDTLINTGTSEMFEILLLMIIVLILILEILMKLEYGDVGTSGIGTVGTRVVSDSNAGVATVQLLCTPIAILQLPSSPCLYECNKSY